MSEGTDNFSMLILVVGVSIILTMLIRSASRRIGVPSIIGFMVLGFLLSVADVHVNCLSPAGEQVFEFLAKLGIITLLFRIGLESKISGLVHQLRKASFIWLSGVVFSGIAGFATCYYLLEIELINSLFVAVALTATSVGIPVGVWQEAGAVNTERGELLIDVAELDDISGIILMALLFAVVPVLRQGAGDSALAPLLAKAIGIITLKLVVFGALCALFSIYVERHITGFFRDIESSPDPMIVIAGIGILIAAIAGLLGFSVAIGAFFAGLVFSRDPKSVKIDTSFETLYEFFSPFFFIGIGLAIAPSSLTASLGLGFVLLIVAVLTKFIGHGLPTWLSSGWMSFLLIGISMVPRAEITMIIMQHGKDVGEWAVSDKTFTAMVLVSAATCIVAPIFMRNFMNKWQIQKE